jgi:hypothetical protein
MPVETYLAILMCYAAGCYAAFRLGRNRGLEEGIEKLVLYMAKKQGRTVKQVSEAILGRKL